MTQEELEQRWNSITPHEKVTLVDDIISNKELPDKYKSLYFIDLKFGDLPAGFKNWLVQFLCLED